MKTLRHYVRGLLDGDGCISGARVGGRLYPYVSLAFNPTREPWLGDLYMRFLDRRGVRWKLQLDRPTVCQVRTWSAEAARIVRLVYTEPDAAWSHPAKYERARLVSAHDPVDGWPEDLFESTRRPYGMSPRTLSFSSPRSKT